MTQADGMAFPVTTRRIADPAGARREACDALGAPTAEWRRGASRLTGFGVAALLEYDGADRFAAAAADWRALAARAVVTDEVVVDGSGPIAFGAFAFADGSAARSVLLLPEVVIGERAGAAFETAVPRIRAVPPAPARESDPGARFPPDAYVRAVRRAVDRIRGGGLEKVVLARDLPVRVPGLDLAPTLQRLADRYEEAWVFAVDGFFGASPETLVTVRGRTMGSRVLAGTVARGDDPESDAVARATLLGSAKNRFEHALAVDSLLLTLGDAVDDLTIGRPFALGLPNVWHLATDATAVLRAGVGALDLVAALHPTAAVAGAPREAALATIAELEPFDRGRYAGPVGWIGRDGGGEWAIGLRSAEVESADLVRAFAGAGVVAASDAQQELAETAWKFAPVLEAVGAPLSAAGAPPAGSVPLAAR